MFQCFSNSLTLQVRTVAVLVESYIMRIDPEVMRKTYKQKSV